MWDPNSSDLDFSQRMSKMFNSKLGQIFFVSLLLNDMSPCVRYVTVRLQSRSQRDASKARRRPVDSKPQRARRPESRQVEPMGFICSFRLLRSQSWTILIDDNSL